MKTTSQFFPVPRLTREERPIVDYIDGKFIRTGTYTKSTYDNGYDYLYFVPYGHNIHGNFINPTPMGFTKGIDGCMKGTRVTILHGSFGDDIVSSSGFYGFVNPVWPSESGSAEQMAIDALFEKVRGELDWSVNAMQRRELGKQANTILSLVNFIRRFNNPKNWGGAIGSARKQFTKETTRRSRGRNITIRRFDGKFPSAKELGSKWLEYQYGWKPIIQDIYDTSALLLRPVQERNTTIKVRKSIQDSRTDVYPTAYGGKSTTVSTLIERCELSVTVSPALNGVQSLSKWSSLNPISIAWETLPYSFVVDWALDIGGYLRSAESSILFMNNFVRGYKTLTTKRSAVGVVSTNYSDAYMSFSEFARGETILLKKDRYVLSGMPFPRFPSFQPRLGSGRLLNAAALLSQFLRK